MGSQKHKHGKNLWVQNVGLVRFALSSRTVALIIFGCQNKLSHNSARLVRRQKGGTAAAGPANERDGKEGGQAAGARSRSASAPASAWRHPVPDAHPLVVVRVAAGLSCPRRSSLRSPALHGRPGRKLVDHPKCSGGQADRWSFDRSSSRPYALCPCPMLACCTSFLHYRWMDEHELVVGR